MFQKFKHFLRDESGAVSVDWVVITAAVVGMSAIGFNVIEDASFGLMSDAGAAISAESDFEAAATP